MADLNGRVSLTGKEIKRFEVQQGDIFFTRTSETIIDIGYPSVMVEPSESVVFSGFVLRARAIDHDPLALNFKQYVFFTKAFRKEMVQKSSMTTRALTSGTAIKQMNYIASNSRTEQTKIGEYFQKLDALIAGHRGKRDKLLQLKKSLLEKMFPKQGQDKPEIRFAGFDGDWKYFEFSKIVFRVANTCDDTKLPRVEYEDIVAGRGQLNKEIDQKLSTKTGIEFQNGDVLYGKLRPYLKNWLLPNFRGIAVGDFWVLRSCEFNAEMIFYLVQTDGFERIANQSAGSKMPRADWKLVSNSLFCIPVNIEEQAKIGQLFKHTDTLINQHQSQIDKLNNIKQACLAQMFV